MTPVFRLLGPLEVVVAGQRVPVPAGKQRTLLAALLLRAGETVPVPELAETLWGADAPENPRSAIQKYVMRLRRGLAGTDAAVRTEPDGYRIEVPPDQLDLARFDELAERGRRAAEAGEWSAAAAHLTAALALWRAVPPLSDVSSEALHRDESPQLVERHLQAVEARVDADLRTGRHAELAGELLGLVRRYPLRERFWAQRMLALHAAGRQGEALAAYREVRTLLSDELGVDPGPEVQAAHQQVLGRTEAPAVARPVARQLPMATSVVVGRDREIDAIGAALEPEPAREGARLVVVTGPAGIGKTTVAVRAAHRLVERYPDGQLFADLSGGAGVDDVLGYFLRALGAAPPGDRADAVAAYRSLTAGRRILVVLDDVPSGAAVRPLLPGSPTCGVLVTSRSELPSLQVCPGGHRVPLGPLGRRDAVLLLRRVIGQRRVRAEPAAVDRLVARCAGSPLALRVAAADLATRPDLRIATHLEESAGSDPTAGRWPDEIGLPAASG